jgi:FSR family fosmidomycin resistance protein-like MFS transporter
MKNKYLFAASAGHTFTDMNPGALPAMLPFIIAAGGLNYAQAAGLTFAVSFASSLSQPFFGILADKLTKAWLMPFGILFAGLGLSLIGFFPANYWLMFSAAMICGIGVAAFHPEGARMANGLAGKNKGGSMGIFSLGGTIGIAIGPLIATPAMLYLGLKGSAVFMIPAITMCVLLFHSYPKMRSIVETNKREERKSKGEQKNDWPKFLWLSIAITARSIIGHSLTTFLPLYWLNVLHQSKATSGMIISYMTAVGAIATVTGGHLADRFGMNTIIKAGWILLLPSFFFLTSVNNPIFTVLILLPITFGNYLVNTPTIVLGQQYLPKNIGFASGITMGLGVSIGGVFAPLLGHYADINGLVSALRLISFLPLLGIIVAFTTKPPR